VLRQDGSQIGYVAPRMATHLTADLAGFTAFVADIDRRGPYLEVSLLLVLNEGADTAAVESYARRRLQGRRDPVKRRTRRTAWVFAVLVALVAWWWLGGS
jgi:hypothetical protein